MIKITEYRLNVQLHTHLITKRLLDIYLDSSTF